MLNKMTPDNIVREYSYIVKYVLLGRYKFFGKYSDEEIIKVLKDLGVEYTKEDFEHYTEKEYLIENIFYKPLWNYYRSDAFKKLVTNFYKKD